MTFPHEHYTAERPTAEAFDGVDPDCVLEAALAYARRGWPVFPVYGIGPNGRCDCGKNCDQPGKHPVAELAPHGVKDATTNEKTIRDWFEGFPDANIGIATGAPGPVVVDVDGPEGEAALRALEELDVAIATLEVRTGRGRHLYFQSPVEPIKNHVKLWPGVDIRGAGGYVVAPPSIHASRVRYARSNGYTAISEMPPALLARLRAGKASGEPKEELKEKNKNGGAGGSSHTARQHGRPVTAAQARAALEREFTKAAAAKEGERNGALNFAAYNLGQIVPTGFLSREEIIERLTTAARMTGLSDAEIAKTLQCGLAAGIKNPRARADETAAQPKPDELWHTPDGEPWVTIGGKHYPVMSEPVRTWLTGEVYKQTGKVPSTTTIKAMQDLQAAQARFHGPTHEAHLRVARIGDVVWLDLADEKARAVRIDRDAWQVVDAKNVPVKFFRPPHAKALPVPVSGSDVRELRPFFNIPDEPTFKLLLTWLAFAALPRCPYPIVVVHGPAGSAKTTFSRIVRAMLDPSRVPTQGVPKISDLPAFAKNHWLPCFDNLSHVRPDLADDLCRLATGGGLGGRRLHTNDGDASFDASRPMVLNGINDVATRGDLADRVLLIPLEAVPPEKRRLEDALWADFEAAQPRILGGLLDVVVAGLRHRADVKMPTGGWPRMADFAAWGVAVAPALGWTGEDFLRAYNANRAMSHDEAIEDDVVALSILVLMKNRDMWAGTADQLMEALLPTNQELWLNRDTFPKTPSVLSRALRRAEPLLATRGISVNRSRTENERRITLKRVS